MIGLKQLRQFFNQWEAKAKLIAPCTLDFSRASGELQVIARNCDWFIALFVPVVIGRSNCFGFGFWTVIWKPLYWTTLVVIDMRMNERNCTHEKLNTDMRGWKHWRTVWTAKKCLILHEILEAVAKTFRVTNWPGWPTMLVNRTSALIVGYRSTHSDMEWSLPLLCNSSNNTYRGYKDERIKVQ